MLSLMELRLKPDVIEIKVKKLVSHARLPTKTTNTDAGWDICNLEHITILPGETAKIQTGICLEIPDGYCMVLFDRSGIGSSGVHRLAGVLDSSYRGPIGVVLTNLSQTPRVFEPGSRIIQGLVLPVLKVVMVEAQELSDTVRGEAGFGASGS